MSDVVYMPLLGEGTECWRPVQARHMANDGYEVVVAPATSDGERWAFPNGTHVRCREHVFSDGSVGLAAYKIAN